MAATEESLDEYLNKLELNLDEIKPVEFTWQDSTAWSPETAGTYTVSSGSISHPSYGAVPNVVIGGGISINATPMWTTTTTNNTGGYTFANQNIQPSTLASGTSGKVHIQGKDADLVIGDKSLKSWMEKVEERLNILTPNPEMEKDWDDLRRLGERYRKLEKKCREKTDMWKKLKSMPAPNIK